MLSRIVPPDLGVAPKGKLLALPKRINLKTLTNNEQHRLRQLYGFGVKEKRTAWRPPVAGGYQGPEFSHWVLPLWVFGVIAVPQYLVFGLATIAGRRFSPGWVGKPDPQQLLRNV